MDEFKMEVTAALADVVGSERADAISHHLQYGQNIDDHLGD
jgi:hypothetical protein